MTLSGTTSFATIDGSASDHDGAANGVFTVNDGNLIVNGVVNCNDDSTESACSMAFAVSGNMTVNAGGALYAENRSGGGTGGAITLTVGGDFTMNGNAIVSSASKSSSGATGGNITANVSGNVVIGTGSTIDSGSSNARAGNVNVAAAGLVSVDGNVLAGPSRTILSTRLTGLALDGGTANQIGGQITIGSNTFAEPAVVVGGNANIISQGGDNGAGPVTIDGCGIHVRGLVAALSRKASAAKVSLRSGKDLVIDARDLGVAGAPLGRNGRVRADAPSGTALNKGVDIFAAETIEVFGASGSHYAVTSLPGLHDSKSYGGLIRITSLGGAITASGNVIDDGHTASGDTGGTVEINAKEDVSLDTAVIRAVGDFNTNNANRGGGAIRVRSYSGDVIWTNGTGEVRPVGSSSNLPLADQGSIVLTACGTVDTTGSSFPVMGTATSVFPETHTGVCSPAAPSLPTGVAPLITCNTPPVANDVNASTNEDTTVTITLTGTDADGDSLTFSIVSGPSNGMLGAIIPTGPTSATVDYTPDADFNGVDSFVFEANDGNGGTDTATATITVAAVNDPPSFLVGPSVTVLEDAGAQTYTNWVTAISAGPADESGQTVTFTVTNDNPSLFSVQPAVDGSGNLTYTPAANAYGTANLSVVAQDDGGTANGGDDTSDAQSSSITVDPVNDAPSFTAGGDVTVNEDSGAYSAAWATAISAGPNETDNVSFVVANDDNSLFSVQPAIDASGVLTFTPAANASGTATVTVYAQDDGGTDNGGDDTSDAVTFTITIDSVNDAPSFTAGGDVTVDEDSGAYSATWATDISAGPANESSQTVTFNVSNDNNALFSAQPAIDAGGMLTFTVAADAFGTATVTVTLSDNGGTANGGDDTSDAETFTITVEAVNDAPSFTAGGNVTVNEDSGAYSATWATDISAGPANESSQTVSFNVSNNNNALFSAQPSISSTGVLTFTPAPNAFGTATVTVSLSDNGGTANGGDNTSDAVTFTITVSGVNDPPSAGNDSWQTFGNTELRVDLAGGTTPNVFDATGSGTGVLDNDSDSVEGDPFAITGIVGCADVTAPFDCAVTGGFVSLNANGTFSFKPSPNATSGSFQYTVTDMPSAGTPASANGTVSISMIEMIWYVNGAAPAGGDGTSSSPYNALAPLNAVGDPDGVSDYIFVHNSNVAGPIALEQGQKLWGEGIGLILPFNLNGNGSPTTLVAAGTRPNVTAAADVVTVTGVTGTEIAGLSLASSGGNAIDVTAIPLGSAAGANIYNNVVTAATAEGIDVNGGSAAGSLVTITNNVVTSTGNAIDVSSVGTTTVSLTAATLSSSAGSGVRMDGTGGTLTITGLGNISVNGNTAVDGIRVTNAFFNNVATGPITIGASGNPVGAEGVVLSGVTGSLSFGTLTVYGGTTGVTITGGGAGFTVTGAAGSITNSNGVGLSITNATIGASNVNLTSINSAGGVNGIVLNNTGASGGLKVTGSGSAGTGGTISGKTGDGVSLTNTAGLSLAWMNISGSGSSGIRGNGVNGFLVSNSSITANGTSAASDDSGINLVGLTGTGFAGTHPTGIVNSTISNNHEFEVQVASSSGTLADFRITNSTISSNGASGSHGNLVNFLASGTASMTLNVSGGSYTGNAPSTATAIHADASGGSITANVSGATFATNNVAVNVSAASSGNLVFDIDGNTASGNRSHAMNFFLAQSHTGTASGKFRNNVIGTVGTAGSGSNLGFGIRVQNEAISTATVLIDNNTMSEFTSFSAINVGVGIPASVLTNTTAVTITDNIIRNVNNARAIQVQQNVGKGTICADIAGNDMAGIAGSAGDGSKIRIRQLAGGTFNVKQKQATAAADPLELDDANSAGANVTTATQVSASGVFNYNAGACAQP